MPLQLRRGTDAQRTGVTFASGEPVWTTDTNKLYVGDGVTPGGVLVSETNQAATATFTTATITGTLYIGTYSQRIQAGDGVDPGTAEGYPWDLEVVVPSGGMLFDTQSGVFINGNSSLSVNNITHNSLVSALAIKDIVGNTATSFSTSSVVVYKNVLPNANNTIDLGSSSTQFRSLYLSSGTLYIDNVPITVEGGVLKVNGQEVSGSANQTLNTTSNAVFAGLTVNGEIIANQLTIQHTTVTTTIIETDDIITTTNATEAGVGVGAIVAAGGISAGKSMRANTGTFVDASIQNLTANSTATIQGLRIGYNNGEITIPNVTADADNMWLRTTGNNGAIMLTCLTSAGVKRNFAWANGRLRFDLSQAIYPNPTDGSFSIQGGTTGGVDGLVTVKDWSGNNDLLIDPATGVRLLSTSTITLSVNDLSNPGVDVIVANTSSLTVNVPVSSVNSATFSAGLFEMTTTGTNYPFDIPLTVKTYSGVSNGATESVFTLKARGSKGSPVKLEQNDAIDNYQSMAYVGSWGDSNVFPWLAGSPLDGYAYAGQTLRYLKSDLNTGTAVGFNFVRASLQNTVYSEADPEAQAQGSTDAGYYWNYYGGKLKVSSSDYGNFWGLTDTTLRLAPTDQNGTERVFEFHSTNSNFVSPGGVQVVNQKLTQESNSLAISGDVINKGKLTVGNGSGDAIITSNGSHALKLRTNDVSPTGTQIQLNQQSIQAQVVEGGFRSLFTLNTGTAQFNSNNYDFEDQDGNNLARFESNGSTHYGNYHNFGNSNQNAQINSQGSGSLTLLAGSDSNDSGYVRISKTDVKIGGPTSQDMVVVNTSSVTVNTTATIQGLKIGYNNGEISIPNVTADADNMWIRTTGNNGAIMMTCKTAAGANRNMAWANGRLRFDNSAVINPNTTLGSLTINAGQASGVDGALTFGDFSLNNSVNIDPTFGVNITTTATYNWVFGLDGNLTLPGDLVYSRTFGSFLNTATITPAAADTAYILPIDTTTTASNVTLSNTGTVTITKAGHYNIQWSIQLDNADNGADHTFNIWVRKNGTNFGNSNTQYTVVKGGKNVAALNIVESFAANDTFELMYAVSDTDITLAGLASQSSPYVRPATPSVILTVTPVGA